MGPTTPSLQSAICLSPVGTPPKTNVFLLLLFVQFGVRQAQIFGCPCSKLKCPSVLCPKDTQQRVLVTGYFCGDSFTSLLWTKERSWRKKVNTSNELLGMVNTMMSSTVLQLYMQSSQRAVKVVYTLPGVCSTDWICEDRISGFVTLSHSNYRY